MNNALVPTGAVPNSPPPVELPPKRLPLVLFPPKSDPPENTELVPAAVDGNLNPLPNIDPVALLPLLLPPKNEVFPAVALVEKLNRPPDAIDDGASDLLSPPSCDPILFGETVFTDDCKPPLNYSLPCDGLS